MAEVEGEGASHQDAAPAHVLAADGTTGLATGGEAVAEKDTSLKASANGVKKENVPPKRPGAVQAKRPGATSTSSAPKPSASSATPSTRTTGGLSKPPTRPAAGSVVRKAPSSATAPTSASAGHKSQPSVGASEDEKKKPLSAAAKRTSLAPSGTSHSPVKADTTAEKRGAAAPSTTARKPATTISTSSTSSPKPAIKPTTSSTAPRVAGTPVTAASRSTPVSKPSSGGAVAEAKKRLSAVSGSPSASKTSTRPAGVSVLPPSSKEVDELRTKLEDREIRVAELQKEITSSQEMLLDLGKRMEEEAQRVSEAEENIRLQHHEMIEKLHIHHKSDIEKLNAQLFEAEAAQKATQESSLKAIEEAEKAASAKGASEAAKLLQNLKSEHAAALDAINLELANAKTAGTTAAAEKDKEVLALKAQLKKANSEITSLSETLNALKAEHEGRIKEAHANTSKLAEDHKTTLNDLKVSLANEHKSALTALKLAHSTELTKNSAEAKSAHEKAAATMARDHVATTSGLQKQLKEAIAAQAALEAAHKQKSDAQRAELAKEISKLKAEVATLKAKEEKDSKSLSLVTNELAELKTTLESTQNELSTIAKKHGPLQAKSAEDDMTLATLKNELAVTRQEVVSLQKMMDAFDSDGRSKDEQHNKVKTELAVSLKSLEDKIKEMSLLEEKHRKELETVSNDYEAEIEALQGNSGIKAEYEDLKVQHEQLTKVHESHVRDMEDAKQGHAAALQALNNNKADHQKELEELKANHAKNLDEAHDRAINAGHAAHAAELEQQQAKHTSAIDTLKKDFIRGQASATVDAEKSKAVDAALRAEIAATKESLAKTEEELDVLKQDLAHEKMAKASAQADLEAAQSRKPDTSEADALHKELQAMKDQHRTALMTAEQKAIKANDEHAVTKSALEQSKAALERQKAETEKKVKTAEADFLDMSDSLTQLVEEANKKAADLEARLKEAEANIKVKDAELAESRTKGSGITSPGTATSAATPSSGLRASKFAEEVDSPTLPSSAAESGAVEGEPDRSSSALASLAKARVTVQQLEQMNEDLKNGNLRSLESITDVIPSDFAV